MYTVGRYCLGFFQDLFLLTINVQILLRISVLIQTLLICLLYLPWKTMMYFLKAVLGRLFFFGGINHFVNYNVSGDTGYFPYYCFITSALLQI